MFRISLSVGGLSPSCTPSGYQSAPVTSLSSFSISLSVRHVEAAGERKEEMYVFNTTIVHCRGSWWKIVLHFYYKCSGVSGTILLVVQQSYMYKSNRSLRLL